MAKMTTAKFDNGTPAPEPNLAELIRVAGRAMPRGGIHRADGTFVPDHRASPIAGANAALSWRNLLPDLIDADGFVTAEPVYSKTSEVATLRTALLQSSVALSFGAHLIELPEPALEADPTGAPVLERQAAGFDVIKPAAFAPVTLSGTGASAEGEVATSTTPIARAAIDRAALEQIAVRIEIPRSELQDHGAEVVESQLLRALMAGAGAALDGVLLRAIAAACDELAATAAPHAICARSGVRWNEVAAILGQVSAPITGLTVENGELRLGGVRAEHSKGAAHAIVGAWDRAALAVSPEVEILMERHGVSGGLIATAWFDACALVPDPAYFTAITAA